MLQLPQPETAVVFTYKNYKGEVATRTVIPSRTYFGSTSFHPEPQWLLEAWDLDKDEPRTFAHKDISGWTPLRER